MRNALLFLLIITATQTGFSRQYKLLSPDGQIRAEIAVDKEDGIRVEVYHQGQFLYQLGPLWMDVEENGRLGETPRIRKASKATVNQVFKPAVREKRAEVSVHYHELSLMFKSGFHLDFRVFDDGIAYRFGTGLPGEIQVNHENFNITFPGDPMIYFPEEESFFTHSEREYRYRELNDIPASSFASLPALIQTENGVNVLLTESDLEDYPGLYIQGSDSQEARLTGRFPAYVLEERLYRDRDVKPEKRAGFLAKTNGTRVFPWRVMAIEEHDKDLMANDIVLRLAPACRLDDTSWIQPGLVSWDWWNATVNHGVDFVSGVNTDTYLYHIDFAAQFGLEYVILDEGWSVPGDIFQINPNCDMDRILSHAREKGVGIILWVLWNALDKDLDRALDLFQSWGVKGIKVDFMQRDDQQMVNYYWKVARAAASRQLLVNFHGSYKPSGIRRAYPNCVNREGLKGLENAKWSELITPDHDCTLPFIRMVAGPMDYTPGAMRNAQKDNFHISFTRPVSMGTRSHQLALYVLYDSPLQMLCDAPSHYYEEPLAMEFLSVVPSVWDETLPLEGKVGDYAVMARQSGDDWFIGAITDWEERTFILDLGFLGEGRYELTEFADGLNAAQYAEDFTKRVTVVTRESKYQIDLAKGGGYAAVLRKL